MNRVTAISSAVTVLAFAGEVHAEAPDVKAPTGIESLLRTYNGINFSVHRISDQGEASDIAAALPIGGIHSTDIHTIRAAIAANAVLAHRLSERGVRVQTIVDVNQATDGSIAFYYR